MKSLDHYRDLIAMLPVHSQSTVIKRKTWDRFQYKDKQKIVDGIFGSKNTVELSRSDVCSETDIGKKLVMVLMWGYPTGGRGTSIDSILKEIDKLSQMLSSEDNRNLTKTQADCLITQFNEIHGLGISTWSKFLHFFDFSIDSKKCQIFDLKIVDSLNKKQFCQLSTQIWRHNIRHYYQYIELIDKLAKDLDVLPEQVELFLFYYNYCYKF